ncbi:MAG: hypothetical protein K2X09_06935 [Rickettsiales bacterium]|nr:hypothetical protein [Rickettsiales bacterium]
MGKDIENVPGVSKRCEIAFEHTQGIVDTAAVVVGVGGAVVGGAIGAVGGIAVVGTVAAALGGPITSAAGIVVGGIVGAGVGGYGGYAAGHAVGNGGAKLLVGGAAYATGQCSVEDLGAIAKYTVGLKPKAQKQIP